jgi:hypothetical protein
MIDRALLARTIALLEARLAEIEHDIASLTRRKARCRRTRQTKKL